MQLFLLALCIALVLGVVWGFIEIVGSIRRSRRNGLKVRIEGKVPSPARSLGQRFLLLFKPKVRKKAQLQEIVIEQLYDLLNQPVVVHASPPEPQALDDGNFHVLLQAGVNPQAEQIERPSNLLNVSCGGDTNACKTSGTGFPIVDPATGFVVGELFDKRLYIHVDILNGGQQPQLRLLDAVLRATRAEIEASRSVKSSLTTIDSTHAVTVEGYEGREAELVAALVRSSLSPAIAKPILVRNAKGNSALPLRNGCFNVFVHSAPVGKLTARPVNQYFSLAPLTQKLTFKASNHGRLVTDTSNSPVGELLENNLYIHLQAIEAATYTELAILKQIFERAVAELKVVATRRAELLDLARKALPDLADKLDVYIESPIVKPADSERFDIYVRNVGQCVTRIPSQWFELREAAMVPFVPDTEPQALWQHDCPVLEVVDGHRVFINADVWSTDKAMRKAYTEALKVLASEFKAKEYIEELFPNATLTGAQSFNFIENGLAGIRKELIEGVARHVVLPRVGGKSVRMIFCKGEIYNPAYDGEFSVFLDSAPMGRKSSDYWGKRAVWKFSDSKLGAPVVMDNGHTTGELVDDNFFLHTEPLPKGTYTEAADFARTLLRVFEVREQVELDRRQVEVLANEILGDRVEDPIAVYTGSRVIRKRVPGAFNIFFGEFTNPDRPAASWWTPSPAGLMALSWVGMPIVPTPIVNDNVEIIGEIVGQDVFLKAGIAPGGFEAKRERLVEVLNHLKADLEYRDYIKDVTDEVRHEDAGMHVPLQVVRGVHFPNARAESLIVGLVNDLLLRRVGTDIDVTHGNNSQVEPADDYKFHVIVAGAPEKERMQTVPTSIFGHKFAGSTQEAFIPSPLGEPIVDEETGFVVGELRARNLYIFEDIIRRATLKDAALVTRVLLEVRKLLVAGSDPQTVSRHFARDCANIFEAAKGTTADSAALSAARQELRKMLIQAQKDEKYYYQADPGADQLGEEFDQILKIPKVTDLEVTNNALTVTTNTIYCTRPDNGVKYEIGAFKITISLRDGNVNWKNLTRQIQGGSGYMHAPHVNSEGRACLGNTQGVFPDLIAKRELVSAVLLAIAFVESVNPGDPWGKYITNWPRAY
jgi:hypothetical protein